MKRYVNLLTAIGLLACSCNQSKPAEKPDAPASEENLYKLTALKKAGIDQTVRLPAQLAAYEQVSIFPKVNGYVKTVLVDIGSHVSAGQVLMTLEAPEIQEQAAQAKDKYLQACSGYEIDRENYQRLKVAAKTAGAISPMDLATARAKMVSDSSLSNSEKANWEAARAMTDYLTVRAPFAGVITQRNTHPGDLVSAESKGTAAMLELKEINHLRLQVDVPESIAGNLEHGDPVDFYLSAFPGEKMTAKIARKADDVNINYRTERIEMDVWNNGEKLSPGMFAYVLIEAKSNPDALIAPKSAVITSTERKYIVAVQGGKARKVDVSTGLENNGNIEVTGALRPDEQIIANANDEIVDGQPIKAATN